MTTDLPVVVGVDGSEPSRFAVKLGIREARQRGLPLRLVHAFIWPMLGVYLGPSPEAPPGGGLAADAQRVLDEALEQARKLAPDLSITGEVVTGSVAPVLIREAKQAALLVLGDRGLGGFSGLLVGSVAVQVASHAPGPLLVARGTLRDDGPVVVGADGSEVGAMALEFAFAEAASRGAELVAVHAWSGRLPGRTADALPLIYDADDVQAELGRQLTEWLAPVREQYPQVVVRELVRHGRTSKVLIGESASAQLVVAGARGHGGFAGLLLGSVSQALLHHAECPVAIVRRPS